MSVAVPLLVSPAAPPLLMRPVSRPVRGIVSVPGSKSITNRALALAALSSGTMTLTGALFADDTRRMIDCLRALGLAVGDNPLQKG